MKPEDAAHRIGEVLASVFAAITRVRDSYVGLWSGDAAAKPVKGELITIRPVLAEQLDSCDGLIWGTGVAVAGGVLADAPHWIEWWARDARGAIHRVAFDLHQDSLDFYDYTVADWFTTPQRDVEHSIVGPYIDYSGTDEYVVTLTMPAVVDGVFMGVAGADLQVADLEHRLRPLERLVNQPVAVVNASGRIIASTSPTRWVGCLLHEGATERYQCPGTPWSLVLLS
jgi:hypothetical protein